MAKRFAFLMLMTLAGFGCSKKEPPRSGGRTAAYWAKVLHEDPDTELRVKAAVKLGPLMLIDNASLPAVVFALKDKDAGVRAAAARSLGVFAGPRAGEVLPSLQDLQEHEADGKVRDEAAKAIENLTHPKTNSG
jgi:HEAT repeat protein